MRRNNMTRNVVSCFSGTLRTHGTADSVFQVQAMQAIKMCNGKLKEDIKVQNQDTYIERSHVHKQLSCRHSAECALKNQEILDLQKQLNDLQTKEQIEQQVHHAVQEQFQELQGSFQLIAASWSAQMSSDSAAKSKALEVCKIPA